MPGKGTLQLTGQLGDVMKESAQMGLSYIRSISDRLGLEKNFYETSDIHIHVPEGAVPKDGPSAGVTMATAMISALTGSKVRKDVAMTGENDAAGQSPSYRRRQRKSAGRPSCGSRVIILPEENRKDIDDIPANIRKELEFHLVRHLDDVLALALVKDKRSRRKGSK